MKRPRRQFSQLAAGTAALTILFTLADRGAWSQTTRTIKIIVPISPGGGVDSLARLLAEQIGRAQRLAKDI
jgi:tripartite-type tricarboxylate transporter receptor subunit TctC